MEIPAVGGCYTNTHASKPYVDQEATQAENRG